MTTTAPTIETVRALAAKYNTWGKWGPDDQLGTLNYITPERIIAAAPARAQGQGVLPRAAARRRRARRPAASGGSTRCHVMLQDGGDIAVRRPGPHRRAALHRRRRLHLLQCATQWDALAHIFHEGKMYNGYGPEPSTAAAPSRTHHQRQGQDGRPRRAAGHPAPPGQALAGRRAHAIAGAELAACAADAGRRGRRGRLRAGAHRPDRPVPRAGSWGDEYAGGPGTGPRRQRGRVLLRADAAAGVATDTWGIEVLPNETRRLSSSRCTSS